MIAVRLEGRLGNQMFQYAFIFAAAQKLNTSFYLDKSLENFIPDEYFIVKNNGIKQFGSRVFNIKGYKNLFNFYLKRTFYKAIQNFSFGSKLIVISNNTQPKLALNQLANGYMYWGYFQSDKYFTPQITNANELFTVKSKYIAQYQKAVKVSPNRKTAAVHIRRGDYNSLGYTLPTAYYRKAIALVSAQDDVDFIFISDDIAFVESEFADITHKQVSRNSEIVDLQILMNADICILANSSFSWWGAYLNAKASLIIAPKYWLGTTEAKEFPVEVIPAQWTKI
ncbi:alpha-1,2-fucosyltransferase [Mucilaginibacter phyllosphaerae]